MKKRNSDKLIDAIRSLEDAIRYARSTEFQGLGVEFKNVLQAAVVQNFSLTFKVCQQMIFFQLKDRFGYEAVEQLAPDAMLRSAAEEGVIVDLDSWLEYLDCEHLSHSSTISVRTFEKASSFLDDAKVLLTTCAQRSQNERRRAA